MRGAAKQRTAVRAPRAKQAGGIRRFLGRAAYGVLALLLAAGVYWLLTTPLFRVTKVEVTGQNLLSRDEVAQATGVLGQSVFAVDRRRVASAVSGLGVLRRVEVAVVLPNAVRVRVEEFEPRYVWQTQGESYLVDERGIVLAPIRSSVPLPAVNEVGGKQRKRGDKVDLAALQTVAKLTQLWPARLGKAPVCDYGPSGLSVAVDKWRADLGDGADIEAKLLALAAVVDHAGKAEKPLTYVDVRIAERPYYK